MENNKIIEKLYLEVCAPVVHERDNSKGLNNFIDFLRVNSTCYYKDILACTVAYEKFTKAILSGIISQSEINYLEEFFSRNIIQLYQNVRDEQISKDQESLNQILQKVEDISRLLSMAEDKEVKKGFIELLSKNHIYHENEYYYHLGKEYSGNEESKPFEFLRNEVWFGVLDVLSKIALEKKNLHQNLILESWEKYDLSETILDLTLKGEVLNSLERLETKSKLILNYCKNNEVELFNAKGSKIDVEYFWQKVVSLIFNYSQFQKEQKSGLLNFREVVLKELNLTKALFIYIEESIIKGDDFLFKDYIDEQKKQFELKTKDIGQIQTLISNSETEKALDILIDQFSATGSEALNELLLLKSRFKGNEKNKLLGLDFDEKMANKVNYGVLEILKEFKNSSS